MAKKNQVYIDIIIDDDGTTKRVAVNAKKLGIELDKAGIAGDKASKTTGKLNKQTKDLDRNLRGTAKMSGNSTKEFSKMQQGMGGVVAAYATLAAQVFAVSAAFQFLQGASDLRNLIDGQRAMGTITGTAYASITASVQEATGAQLKFADAARGVAIGTAAGLSAGQLERLASAAKNVSFALGRDLTDSYNRLVRGVTKAEPELLDELGIILRLDTALSKYSVTVGKTVKELNAFERGQAVAAETLEQSERKFASIEHMMSKDAVALAQFTKSFDELSNVLKKGVITGLTPVFQLLSESAGALSAALLLLGLPVLKAMLPDLKAAQKDIDLTTQSLAEQTEEFEAQQTKKQEALKITQRTEADAAKKSRELMDKKGVGKQGKTGIMAFLAQEDVRDARSKKSAQTAVSTAKAQIKAGVERTGTLSKLNMTELDELDDHIEKKGYRIQHGDELMAKKDDENKRKELKKGKKHNKSLGMLNKAKGIGIGGMSKLLTGAGYLGILVMFGQVIMGIYDYFTRLDEEMQKQQDKIDTLLKKYKSLNSELKDQLANSGSLTGAMYASATAQRLSSIDVKKFLTDYDSFQSSIDQTTEGFKKQKKEFIATARIMKAMNSGFNDLSDTMENFEVVTAETKKQTLGLDSELKNIGQTIDRLPEIVNETETALKSLMEEFITPTKSESFAEKLERELEALDTKLLATKDILRETLEVSSAAFAATQKSAQKIEDDRWAAQDLASNQMKTGSKSAGGTRAPVFSRFNNRLISDILDDPRVSDADKEEVREKYARGNDPAQTRKENQERFQQKSPGGNVAGASTLNTNQAVEPKTDAAKADDLRIQQELQQTRDRRKAQQDKVLALLAEEKRLEQGILDTNHRQAAMQTEGATLAGKITNEKAKLLKLEVPLLKAQRGVARAQMGYQEAIAATGKYSEEQQAKALLNLKNAEKLERTERVILNAKQAQTISAIDNLTLEEKQTQEAAIRAGLELKIAAIKDKINRTERQNRDAPAYRGAAVVTDTLKRDQKKQERLQLESDRRKEQNAFDARKEEIRKEDPRYSGARGSTPELFGKSYDTAENSGYHTKGHENYLGAGLDADMRSRPEEMKGLDAANAALATHDSDPDNVELKSKQALQKQSLKDQLEMTLIDTQRVNSTQFMINKQMLLNKGYKDGIAYKDQDLEAINATAEAMTAAQKLQEQKQELAAGISSSMEGAFMSLIDGTKNAKQAFGDMALGILKMIAKMIIQMMVLKMLQTTMPGLFPTDVAAPPAVPVTPAKGGRFRFMGGGQGAEYAKGGYSYNKNNFSRGGVARGQTAGYAATLHGNEAVVPLPDNRSIPVSLNGAGAQNNNVSVSINMEKGNSKDSSADSAQGEALGSAIASAVQKELLHQKRSGGILNPYGVA